MVHCTSLDVQMSLIYFVIVGKTAFFSQQRRSDIPAVVLLSCICPHLDVQCHPCLPGTRALYNDAVLLFKDVTCRVSNPAVLFIF